MGDGAPTAPTPFGKYLLDREIARGGMARVWLARLRGHGGFEKRLVVKQILPHLADDPRFVSLFVEEAKTLVQLSHPHIVPVYELGVVEGTWFLAMEHVEGATLASILEGGPLEADSVAHLGVQLADALSYAHDRFQLVHRDVTPRNVIVERTGHARLLDFGIAARATPAGEAGTGAVYGTPGYVSPEQARGEAIDPRSDLFALGCVLFEAVSGTPAFPRDDLAVVRNLEPAQIPTLPEALGELASIVHRCLEPSPAERPVSARELGRMLRAWLNAREVDDPGHALAARVERAQSASAERAPASVQEGAVTPGTARLADRSLATSRLLDEIVTPPVRVAPAARADATRDAREGAESGPGTLRLDRPRSAEPLAVVEAPPGASPSPARSWLPGAAFSLLAGALAVFLVSRAGYDPLAPDPARSDTDVDGTMWIDPSDGDVLDGGIVSALADTGEGRDDRDAGAPIEGALDGGDGDGGPDARTVMTRPSDGGPRVRAPSATLRVTSDGNAALTLDGHALGHAPVHETVIGVGAHTLEADCVALGRSGRASFRAAAGAAVRARVNCTADPVTVVVAGAE